MTLKVGNAPLAVSFRGRAERGTRNPRGRKGLAARWTPGSHEDARPGVTLFYFLQRVGIAAYALIATCVLAASSAHAQETLIQSRLADHIEEIRAVLVEKGAAADARITLAAPEAAISVEVGAPLFIQSASYNSVTGRFLIRARGAEGTPLVAIVGAAESTVSLPVPTHAIERNQAIGEEDIDWIEMSGAGANVYLSDADLIVGKIARRPLAAGAPLRKGDLMAPILIKRGAIATIVLKAPGLRLTQAAVAEANGAAGELIAFRNVNSDRDVKAVVIGKDLAETPYRGAAGLAALER